MSQPGAKRAEWSRIPCGRWSDGSDNQPATQHDGISTLLLLVPSSWDDAVENVILAGAGGDGWPNSRRDGRYRVHYRVPAQIPQ